MSNPATIDLAVIPEMTVGDLRVFLQPHQLGGLSPAQAASALVRDLLAGWIESGDAPRY